MKKLTNLLMIPAALLSLSLSGCLKKFDAKSYAPPLVINGYTSSSEVAKSDLVAYYAFNGSLIDSVSNTSGTATGVTFTKGEIKQGLQGVTNGYVLAPPSDKVKALTSFTISEWVNTQPPPSTGGIIGIFTLADTTAFWGNIEIFFENGSTNANGTVKVFMNQGANSYTYAVSNLVGLFGKWINVTASYTPTGGVCKLYINGALVNTGAAGTLTGPLNFQNIGKLVFGCVQFMTTPSQTSATGAQPWAGFLVGTMDEVRVYDKPLADADISALVALQGRGK